MPNKGFLVGFLKRWVENGPCSDESLSVNDSGRVQPDTEEERVRDRGERESKLGAFKSHWLPNDRWPALDDHR